MGSSENKEMAKMNEQEGDGNLRRTYRLKIWKCVNFTWHGYAAEGSNLVNAEITGTRELKGQQNKRDVKIWGYFFQSNVFDYQ